MDGESTSPIGNLWKNLLRSFDQELHHYSLWYNQSSSCYIFSWCCILSLTPRPLIGPPWNVAFDLSPEQLIQLSSWSGLLNLKKICVFSLKFKGKMKEILSIINHTCTFKPVYTYIICFLVEWMLRICINNNRTIQAFPKYSIIFVIFVSCPIVALCWKHTLQICSVD